MEKEDINVLKVLSPVVDRPLSVDRGETFDFCFKGTNRHEFSRMVFHGCFPPCFKVASDTMKSVGFSGPSCCSIVRKIFVSHPPARGTSGPWRVL